VVTDVEKQITQLWEAGDAWRDVMPVSQAHDLVRSVIGMLDRGEVRVAEIGEDVVVNEWAKLAILMWFRVQEMQIIEAGPFEYVDKLPLKKGYKAAGVRVVPGASARFGAYLAPTVVMMTLAYRSPLNAAIVSACSTVVTIAPTPVQAVSVVERSAYVDPPEVVLEPEANVALSRTSAFESPSIRNSHS